MFRYVGRRRASCKAPRELVRGSRTSLLVLTALAVASGADSACQPCAASSDIQVTVDPAAPMDTATSLRVTMSLDGAAPKMAMLPLSHPLVGSSAFLLHPDPAPSARYRVAVTVDALDAHNQVLATGADQSDVSNPGCNRLFVQLSAPGASPDAGALPPDAGMLPPPVQPSSCSGGLPDEDADNLPNSCDRCPADADPVPVDSDGDNLPDACDPDPLQAGNRLVYFDPFDVASGHFGGGFPVSSSDLVLDSPGRLEAGNMVDALPVNVRVQVNVIAGFLYANSPGPFDYGLFLGDFPDVVSGSGVLCTMHRRPDGDFLEIRGDSAGSLVLVAAAPVGFIAANNRLRLTQRGGSYLCEAFTPGLPPVSVSLQSTSGPPGSQYVALWSEGVQSHFHSVVAESAAP
jgi:hypothetical protein